MKKVASTALVIMVASVFIGTWAFAENDISEHGSCQYCGMNRKMFAHSRMLLTYEGGKEVGTCSIHCLAVDLSLNIDMVPKSIQVADYKTKNLIDAENAIWVIGGSKPGVMTKRAKWAFEKQSDADAFLKANGGQAASFDQAMKATYEDMYTDTKMIREKRKKMRMMKKK